MTVVQFARNIQLHFFIDLQQKMADGDVSTDTSHALTLSQTLVLVSYELLCYVANIIDTIPTDIIVLLCAGQYDNGVIETVKHTLYNLCTCGNGRYIQRKENKKKTQNLEDNFYNGKNTVNVLSDTKRIP